MEQEVRFDYDDENDSLFIYRAGDRSRGSVEVGDFIIDFNMNLNKAVSLEIMNASKTLSFALSNNIDKAALSNIKAASLSTSHKDNVVYVQYGFMYLYNNKKVEEKALITVPISRQHKSMAC